MYKQRFFAIALLVCGLSASVAQAEVYKLALRQVLELAIKQNPDIAIAHLDERKAAEQVRIAQDPFVPKVIAGSGLAYSTGYPMSIDGAAPSIVQAKAVRTIYNRTQSYQLLESRENYRAATIDASARRDDILYRIATLYVDAERAAHEATIAARQIEIYEKVSASVSARVSEGRELEIENKRARFNLNRERQRVEELGQQQSYLESSLALVLGYSEKDRVQTVEEEHPVELLEKSEDAAVAIAIENSKDLKKMQSLVLAKNLEVKAQRSSRYPQFDLVAQYGLFAQYNYQDYFRRFQRHNGQLGMSLQIPLWTGNAAAALAAQAELDVERLRKQIDSTRAQISLNARKAFQDYHSADTAREIAREDLEIAREQLSIDMAKMEEGRLMMSDVEKTRALENDKWLAFYDSQYQLRKARLNVLRQTGSIMAAIQ